MKRRGGRSTVLGVLGAGALAAVVVGCAPAVQRPQADLVGTRSGGWSSWSLHSAAATRVPVTGAREFEELIEHPRVVAYANGLNHGGRVTMRAALERSGRYIDVILKALASDGVPTELASVPAVESLYDPHAYYRGTVGLWQFTRSTGKLYGLTVDHSIDERRDPEASSVAAARYLRDLFERFESWDLALAAYNAGPGRVARALKRRPGATFWELADHHLLPPITREYVPKVAATALVARDPERYQFGEIVPETPVRYDRLSMTTDTSIDAMAAAAGMSSARLAALNPALRSRLIPAGFEMRVPIGTRDRFEQRYASLR